jgi:FemAB-related protein (PEP-CTERM system-associated)
VTLTVERFAGDVTEWDRFVQAAAGGTVFHRCGWRSVMEGVFGHETSFLCARAENGSLEGVLPLVHVRSRVFGGFLVSMPFLNYGGPLGSAGAVRGLAGHAVEMARDREVDLLELRSAVVLPLDLPVSHRKVTVVLDLPAEGSEHLWRGLKAKLRSQIRKPRGEGLTVRFGPHEVEPFYSVFARHMRDLGTPVLPLEWFQRVQETFSEEALVGCAYHGVDPVAAGWGFRWGDEFELTWAASLRRYNALAPNMLLYWTFLERCCSEGVRRFNFGRCTPGGGTHRFKLQWGGHDEPLWWYQETRGRAVGTPSADDRRYAWGPRVWKRLPLPVANVLGPRIVRFLP